MSFLAEVLRETWTVVAEAAPWLFVGFLFAGLLKAFVPGRLVARKLGGDDLRSVLLASLYGTPIPLCSCSVIPTASALRAAGASKGATSSFLISTPETGVDSISVTYALLDPWMTLLRPLAAFASAVLTGSTVNVLVRRGWDVTTPAQPLDVEAGCCGDAPAESAATGGDEHGHAHGDELELPGAGASVSSRARAGVRYAFVDLLDDLTPVLLVGLLLSGLIAALLPESFFTEIVPGGLPTMFLMLVVGTPLYVCATASTPIAAALIAKGLDPGAALVFLLVGPATNVTTLLVVGKLLGRRVLSVYLFGVVGVALLMGIGANLLYARLGIDLGQIVASELHRGPGPVALVAGVALLLLLARSAVRIRLDRVALRWIRAPLRSLGWSAKSRELRCFVLAGAVALLAAASSSCETVLHESPTNMGSRTLRRANPTEAWDIVLDGENFGRVVRYDVDGWPQETRFVVQNPFGQDLGLVDVLGRAYRYRPHAEPVWVGSGTVSEGAAAILGLTGNPRLEAASLDATEETANQAGAGAPDAPHAKLRKGFPLLGWNEDRRAQRRSGVLHNAERSHPRNPAVQAGIAQARSPGWPR